MEGVGCWIGLETGWSWVFGAGTGLEPGFVMCREGASNWSIMARKMRFGSVLDGFWARLVSVSFRARLPWSAIRAV